VLAASTTALAQVNPPNTAFVYQGVLRSGGTPVDGPKSVRFSLFDAATGGTSLGPSISQQVIVADGLFSIQLDFGVSQTPLAPRFLQIEVQESGSWIALTPRQRLTAAPVATNADRALTTDALPQSAPPSSSLVASQTVVEITTASNDLWQAFIPNGTAPLSQLTVTRRGSATVATAQLQIYEGAGPAGQLIHSQPVWLPASGEALFNLVPPPTLTGGQTYTWRLTTEGTMGLAASNSDPLPGLPSRSGSNIDLAFRAFTSPQGNTLVRGERVGIGISDPAAPLHVGGGTDATPTGGGVLVIGNTAARNIAIDGNEILARDDGSVAELFLSNEGRVVVGGSSAADATLHVQAGDDIRTGDTPFLQLGSAIGSRLEFDVNDIQARSGISTAAVLSLNFDGGAVHVGDIVVPTALSILQVGGNAAKPGGGAWAILSDRTAKTDIKPLAGTLDRLLRLHGYSFRYTEEALAQGGALPGTQLGLMAQEVQNVFPDWVFTDDQGRLNVTERATTALMVEALRDLRAEKDAADQRAAAEIDALKRDNAELKARLERLEKALAKP
jgi:hypothetical protein